MSSWIKKILPRIDIWVRKYAYYIALVIGLIVVVGYIIYLKRKADATQAEFRMAELRMDLYRKRLELHSLETKRELIKLHQNYTEKDIKDIEEKIIKAENKIIAIHKEIAELSLEEKIDEYNRLGK